MAGFSIGIALTLGGLFGHHSAPAPRQVYCPQPPVYAQVACAPRPAPVYAARQLPVQYYQQAPAAPATTTIMFILPSGQTSTVYVTTASSAAAPQAPNGYILYPVSQPQCPRRAQGGYIFRR